ncbi:hypothetical protein CAEBREN_10769 [Caenorhabditis brenneri]|uniref:Uncharacterized protein n=1 Tax=Caenorhabditis brenneri TaxID=135651 RepID=G0MG21_CAEBE|nr:hypothetical protein CAEBREN_10769 [Caenorhabditis brenneri]
MSIREQLYNVDERGMLFQIFNDIKNYLTVFPPILDKLCPIRSIIGLSHGLSNVSHKTNPATFRDVMTVLSWLKQVAEQGFTTAICDSLKADEMDADSVQLYEVFTKACMSLPEQIMNCCAKALTEEHFKYITLVKTVFQNQMLQGIQESLLIAHKTPTANLKTVSELISAGRNVKMNSKDTLLELLMQWISEIEDFDTRWKELMRLVFLVPTTLGDQVHEALLTAVFMGAKDDHAVALRRLNLPSAMLQNQPLLPLPHKPLMSKSIEENPVKGWAVCVIVCLVYGLLVPLLTYLQVWPYFHWKGSSDLSWLPICSVRYMSCLLIVENVYSYVLKNYDPIYFVKFLFGSLLLYISYVQNLDFADTTLIFLAILFIVFLVFYIYSKFWHNKVMSLFRTNNNV